jgi:hypothetical protein
MDASDIPLALWVSGALITTAAGFVWGIKAARKEARRNRENRRRITDKIT